MCVTYRNICQYCENDICLYQSFDRTIESAYKTYLGLLQEFKTLHPQLSQSILEIRRGYRWVERSEPKWYGSQESYFSKDWYLYELALETDDYLYKDYDDHCERYYDRDSCDGYIKRLGVEFKEYNQWLEKFNTTEREDITFTQFKADLDE